ncbi:cytochrome P450 [Streptomyces sp. 549]|uniref:cytochrome P450 n=1 Tax=Streptomyces sp. 549 TaxID=3049076 RepID=UPI0024C335B1|nr:cytochrome P450 [Streptomyces sp. 549]MDK1474641.1 cytochrome P450 [Streptomyces sp. 549]
MSAAPAVRRPVAAAPGALPLLGHALPLRRSPLAFLAALPACGDLVEVRLGPRRAHLVCDPDLVQQVLRDSRTYDKGGPLFDKVRLLTGDGLATSDWEVHRRQRRLMQPAFQVSRMAGYAEVMNEEIAAVLAGWTPGRTFDVNAAMQAMTARIIVRTLFAAQIDERAVTEIQQCLPVFTRGVYRRMVAPFGLMERLPTPANRRFDQALARLHSVIERTITAYRADADHGDLMSTLVNATDSGTGERLTPDEIHEQVVSLLLGGTETTGNVLSWSFHLLDENPQARERLFAEVDEVLDGRLPVFTDLSRMPYARRVLTESLRLYPSTWLLSRSTTAPATLGGLELPAGSIVLFSFYAIGRDARHFTDPERFDPDRWLPERAAGVPRSAQLSFGAGSRKCIGDQFALVEALLLLTAVSSRWRLRGAPGFRAVPEPKASLSTGPLPMTGEPRSPGER